MKKINKCTYKYESNEIANKAFEIFKEKVKHSRSHSYGKSNEKYVCGHVDSDIMYIANSGDEWAVPHDPR